MRHIFDFKYLLDSIPLVARGIPTTLSIAVVAFVFGSMIGIVIALLRIYRVPVITQLAVFYVSFMRGTPLLVQIFLAYYGIPIIFRIFEIAHYINKIPSIYYLYVAFSLNVGAYLSEVFRAAIVSLPKGQMEAAYSIGMTTPQALWKIIFPQALESALPSIGNQFIMLLKNTSLAFVIGVPEIIGEAKIVAGRTSKVFEVYIVAAMLYWSICLVVEQVLLYAERYLKKHHKEQAND